MEIGERLKEARIAKGYSLEDIQEKTKIQKRYLQAIENDNYDALPGKFYARAFVKEYALIVDLDPEELLAHIESNQVESLQEETVVPSRMERTKRSAVDKGSSLLSFLPTLIVVLLVIAIIVTAIIFFQRAGDGNGDDGINSDNEVVRNVNNNDENNNNDANNNDNENNNNDDANNNDDENNEEEDEVQFEVETVGEGGTPLSEINVSNVGDKIVLKFEASEDSYIDVSDVNDNWLFIDTVTSGGTEEVDVSDQERVLLNVGYTPTMTVYINDVELEYPVDSSQSTHQKIWLNFEK